MVTDLAELLSGPKQTSFSAEPFYEPATDSLIFYAKDVRSYGKRIGKYFTVFLSLDDKSIVGYEIKGWNTIRKAVEDLGTVMIAGPVSLCNDDGRS